MLKAAARWLVFLTVLYALCMGILTHAALVVVSGPSMTGTLNTGDVALAIRYRAPRVGDIAVFETPGSDCGKLTIHQIVGGDASQGWVTQGTNNPDADPWPVPDANIRGIVVAHIPQAGQFLYSTVGSPASWFCLIAAAGALLYWPSDDNNDNRDKEGQEE